VSDGWAYLPGYWLAIHVGPRTFTAILAAIHALNAPLVWLLARRLKPGADKAAIADAALATLVGMTAATVWEEVGTTFFDIVSSLFVLAALLLLIPSSAVGVKRGATIADRAPAAIGGWRLAGAGLLLGIATGLKLVNGVYVAAAGLAWLLARRWPRSLGEGLLIGTGALAGFLAAAGWWMSVLWREYANPFFPYFNSLFRSPWLAGVPTFIASGTGADYRFIPVTPLAAAAFPIKWALGRGNSSSELPFRDPRVLLILVLLGIVIAAAAWRRRAGGGRHNRPPGTPSERFLVAFWGLSLLVWIRVFAIQRYLVPLEALSGVLLLVALRHLARSHRAQVWTLAVLTAMLLVVTRPPHYGTIPFRDELVPITAVRPLYRPGALYVMVGEDALAYVIPAMPHDARFVRIDGNLRLNPRLGFGPQVAAAIAHHSGPIMTLGVGAITPDERVKLARFGLLAMPTCRTASGLGQTLVVCMARRMF
jgi:hypothetical protein